jgi:hypothetical protein
MRMRKHAAFANDAVDLDASTVLRDDRVADGQTEARSPARGFVVKNGSKIFVRSALRSRDRRR